MDLARDANLEANMVVLVCFGLVGDLEVTNERFEMISRFRSTSRLVLLSPRSTIDDEANRQSMCVCVRPETRRKAQLAP